MLGVQSILVGDARLKLDVGKGSEDASCGRGEECTGRRLALAFDSLVAFINALEPLSFFSPLTSEAYMR